MALKDSEMRVFAGFGTLALCAALVAPTVWLSSASAETGPILKDLDVIEASVAYKAPKAPKQPQKPTHQADPEVKPEGVSHDETKKPDDKKPDPKDDKVSKDQDPLAKFKRHDDDDTQVGKAPPGAFDGSEFGTPNAMTKGDPFFQQLVIDLGWQSPELARAGVDPPIGCIHMTNDGKIVDTTFKQKSDDDVTTLAEAALKALQKKRNDHPIEVPTHLLDQLTTKWVCFKFTVKASE